MSRRTGLAVVAAAFVLMLSRTGDSQVLYGSLVGSVTDASGGSVPDATVKVTRTETNETRETKTNESGGYTLSTLPAGEYTVSISKEGFKTYSAQNIQVRLNTVVRVDAALQIGQLTEAVNVTAEGAQLQTDRADVHSEIGSQAFVDLPQPTRTYQGLFALMPGISPPSASSGGTNNPAKSMQFSANGTGRSGANIRIDGVSATNPWVQFFTSTVPSQEAIETVNVVTNSPDAEQGLANGASVNVQLKSGSNETHGSAYIYNIDSAFKSRPFFLPAAQGIPKLIENDYGATLGGHVVRNKLFYFVSYEGDPLRQGNANLATVPTAAIRSGDMSGSGTLMYDPNSGTATGAGRTPFANNQIPASMFSPITQKLVGLIPQANLPGLTSNYYVNTPISYDLEKLDTKVDWNASSKLRLTGRVGDVFYNEVQATIFGDTLSGGNNHLQSGSIFSTAVSATYIASPTLVIDGTWGLTWEHQILFPPLTDTKYGSDVLGIPGNECGSSAVGRRDAAVQREHVFGLRVRVSAAVYSQGPDLPVHGERHQGGGGAQHALGVGPQPAVNGSYRGDRPDVVRLHGRFDGSERGILRRTSSTASRTSCWACRRTKRQPLTAGRRRRCAPGNSACTRATNGRSAEN